MQLRLFLQSSSDKSDWAAKPTQSSCVQRITREGSILIKEPVSTTQVSSGRLESSTALKGTEKFLPRPGIEPGLLDCRSSVLTTILPRAWYFSVCSPEYSLRLFLQSSSDKSDWASLRPHSINPREGIFVLNVNLFRPLRSHQEA